MQPDRVLGVAGMLARILWLETMMGEEVDFVIDQCFRTFGFLCYAKKQLMAVQLSVGCPSSLWHTLDTTMSSPSKEADESGQSQSDIVPLPSSIDSSYQPPAVGGLTVHGL